ncbi:MAG TPA: hypothetical protein VI168_08560 [Croceibacterium sp.]
MTCATIARLAAASLAPVLVLAAAPALHAQAPERVPGTRYSVVNQTGAALACRYRVNGAMTTGLGRWQDPVPIAADAEFSRAVEGPGESLSLDCAADGERPSPATVLPGRRYAATRGEDGKLVVARVRD